LPAYIDPMSDKRAWLFVDGPKFGSRLTFDLPKLIKGLQAIVDGPTPHVVIDLRDGMGLIRTEPGESQLYGIQRPAQASKPPQD